MRLCGCVEGWGKNDGKRVKTKKDRKISLLKPKNANTETLKTVLGKSCILCQVLLFVNDLLRDS